MAELYDYLADIMPIKRVLFSLAVGMVSLFIVLISGLTSDFVSSETIASRTFSAFSFTTLACFIILMSGEEYAIFRVDKELEHFVDDAPLADTAEEFNREEYLYDYLHYDDNNNEDVTESEETDEEDVEMVETFRPMNFGNFSNQS